MINLPKVPASMCNQSITLKQAGPRNDWGEVDGTIDTPISNCVVQLSTVYNGNNNGREVVASGRVFLYADHTTPMIKLNKSNLGDKIEYDGQEYTLKNVTEHRNPFNNDIWGYELEVL